MNVIRASVLGFCFGVKRAVSAADEALKENMPAVSKKRIFSLGPLIHNPAVHDELKTKGLEVIDESSVDSLEKNDVVVIRAHGTTPAVMQKLTACGVKVLDETCPRVHASQLLAAKWASSGYTVIIAGDKNHGEVTGISGYASNVSDETHVVVVQNKAEAAEITVPQNAVLLAQTTFSPESFAEIASTLKEKNKNLLVYNTICSATLERQNALRELAGKADGIIVIGGKNSANTRRLYETAQSICANAALIENASQIPEKFFALETVALTAGASTPDSVIDKVAETLQKK